MKISDLFEAPVKKRYDPHDLHNALDPEHPKHVKGAVDIKGLAEMIRTQCKTMLDAYEHSSQYLYRGLGTTAFAITTKIRQDRKPVEMDRVAHERLHAAFKDAGLEATRKNSIFCSTNLSIASQWGSGLYMIFVKDGWTGTVFENQKKDYAFYKMQHIGKIDDAEQIAKEVKKLKPKSFKTSAELSSVINSRYEDILITGDSYIAVRVSNVMADSLRELMEELDLPITPKLKAWIS
jgi:hypothetical protein